jgi:uncharacterized protein (UPF0548 family)
MCAVLRRRVLFVRASGDAVLDDWARRPFATEQRTPGPRDRLGTYERVIATEAAGPPIADGPHRRAAAAILAYDIFPPRIGRRVVARSPLQVGDTVGLRYKLALGVEMFFASRVIDVFDEQRGQTWHTGFTYRTLTGHPELGEETFSVEKELATGKVLVALRSWSRHGILLSRMAAPFARFAQKQGSDAALDHLQRIATAGT